MSMSLNKSASADTGADDIDEAAEAERQAQRIREFWAKRGHMVHVWAEIRSSDKDGSAAHWIVRSDLVAGRPR